MRVLYVDDDIINARLFVETCRFAREVDVQTAASGAEALTLAARWRPDFLVIDLHLPDTSGYDLLPALRTALAQPGLAAFLCTADDEPLVEQPAHEAGFDGRWTKPVALQLLLNELRHRSSGAAAR